MTLRASFLRAALLWVATFGVVFMATEARAQAPSRPVVVGVTTAGLNVSEGAAWADIEYDDWVSLTSRSVTAAMRMSELTIVNTHATQALFFLLRQSAAEATTHMGYVGPGAAVTLQLWGEGVSEISVQGAGAATTAKLLSKWATP